MLQRGALMVLSLVSHGMDRTTEVVAEVPGKAARIVKTYIRHLHGAADCRSRYARLARELKARYRPLRRSR